MCADRSGPLGPSDFGVDRFTVPAVLDRRAEQYPDRVMMSIAGVEVTFEQMRQRSCAAANMLADLGVGRGDCVALFTATCPEWVYFWLGAARIGAVSAAVNAANKGDFLLHTLRLSRAKVILTDAERRPRVDEVAGQLDTVTDVVVQDDSLTDALMRPAGGAGRLHGGRGRGVPVLHVGHHRAVESGCHHMALPVLGGRDRRVGLGIRPGRGAVDRDAAVPPERGAQRAGPDAGRRNDRAGRRVSSRRRVGRRACPRCHRLRRRRRDGVDAAEPARRSRATHSCRCGSSPLRPSTRTPTTRSKSATAVASSRCTG